MQGQTLTTPHPARQIPQRTPIKRGGFQEWSACSDPDEPLQQFRDKLDFVFTHGERGMGVPPHCGPPLWTPTPAALAWVR